MDNLDFNFFCGACKRSREYREANCFTKYRVRRFERGEYLAVKGDRVRELSVVVSGAVNVSFVLESGVVMRSVDHAAPVPIGGVALFSKENRYMVDTRALEPCEVISVSREEVMAQMGRCEDFLVSFIDYSASRVGVITEHLAALSQRSVAAKLAYYILLCSEGLHFRFPRSVQEVAEYLCVERPSLSRVISQFVQWGVITYHRGEGEILDAAQLRSFLE